MLVFGRQVDGGILCQCGLSVAREAAVSATMLLCVVCFLIWQDLEKQAADLQQAAPNLKAMEQYDAIRVKEKEQVGAAIMCLVHLCCPYNERCVAYGKVALSSTLSM